MKSSKLLALGLVLLVGACSAMSSAFLDKVKGKGVYVSATSEAGKIGQFSNDGKTFTIVGIDYKAKDTSDDNTGTYEYKVGSVSTDVTFTTTDGKTGSYTAAGLSTSVDVWYR